MVGLKLSKTTSRLKILLSSSVNGGFVFCLLSFVFCKGIEFCCKILTSYFCCIRSPILIDRIGVEIEFHDYDNLQVFEGSKEFQIVDIKNNSTSDNGQPHPHVEDINSLPQASMS